jgi:crotonobetainyl-CoA:carnitine CoA-transferase CaiB-like acyl-CoA transferase
MVKERAGSGSNISSPRNVYRCRDGAFVALSGSTQAMARRIFTVIGCAEMIEDARFCSNAARVKHRVLVDEAVGSWFAARSRERDGRAGLHHCRCRDGYAFPRALIVEVEDRELGALPMHNIVPRLSVTPGMWRLPAPRLGEHTA